MPIFTSLYRDDLPHRAITVFMYLYDRADKNMTCYPSVSTIGYELNLSTSTVKRAISDLLKTGYLTKEHRFRQKGAKSSNLYTLKKM